MSNSANHIDTAILWTLLCSCVTSAVGQENADVQPTKLVHNKPFSATMDLDEEPIHGFVVSIPATARSMSVEVTDTPLLFDIFGQHEDSPEDFDHQSNDSYENQLWVTRDDEGVGVTFVGSCLHCWV